MDHLISDKNLISEDKFTGIRAALFRSWINIPDKKMWLNIPKNASNTVGTKLLHSPDWLEAPDRRLVEDIDSYKIFVAYRDPVKRWMGVIGEFCNHGYFERNLKKSNMTFDEYFDDQDFMDFERRRYDIHIIPQVAHLQNLKFNQLFFANVDSPNFNCLLKEFFGFDEFEHRNATIHSKERRELALPKIKAIMDEDKIREFYKDDYKLISMIEG